jgi:hypothetical protein
MPAAAKRNVQTNRRSMEVKMANGRNPELDRLLWPEGVKVDTTLPAADVIEVTTQNGETITIFMSVYSAGTGPTCPKCGYRPMEPTGTTGCYKCPKCGWAVVAPPGQT